MGLDNLGKRVSRKELAGNNGVYTARNIQIGETCDERMSLWGVIVGAPMRHETGELAYRLPLLDLGMPGA